MLVATNLAVLVLALAFGSVPDTYAPCDETAWRRALDAYWTEYPNAEAADLYKFAHQGIMGSEHAVSDTASVAAWMRREVASLSAHREPPPHRAPLVEPLPPDGRFVRVHLRPYLARKADPSRLVREFVATANGPRGDTAQFACAEKALKQLASHREVSATLALIAERRRTGFDAAHHSKAFESAYAPAYRVIRASRVAALIPESTRPSR